MQNRTENDRFARAREQMLTRDLKGRDITDPRVLEVMADIPRHEFVPGEYHWQAYADGPLPIGLGQTISQPYIVALMTQLLRITADCDVLEIGTGSGYQTAVISRLARRVYTIEKFAELSQAAQAVLGKLDIRNIEFHIGDGSCGWPGDKTFDRIMVTAAVPTVPHPLIDQLTKGGLIVAPVGGPTVQELIVGEKKRGKLMETLSCGCRFVRLVGKYGFTQ